MSGKCPEAGRVSVSVRRACMAQCAGVVLRECRCQFITSFLGSTLAAPCTRISIDGGCLDRPMVVKDSSKPVVHSCEVRHGIPRPTALFPNDLLAGQGARRLHNGGTLGR